MTNDIVYAEEQQCIETLTAIETAFRGNSAELCFRAYRNGLKKKDFKFLLANMADVLNTGSEVFLLQLYFFLEKYLKKIKVAPRSLEPLASIQIQTCSVT